MTKIILLVITANFEKLRRKDVVYKEKYIIYRIKYTIWKLEIRYHKNIYMVNQPKKYCALEKNIEFIKYKVFKMKVYRLLSELKYI